jgi:hypothetical protein
MPEETGSVSDFEIYCMFCNRPLTDDDDIHLTFGPYGYDFDVMCGECMEKSKQLQAGAGGGLGDSAADDQDADPLDLLAGSE